MKTAPMIAATILCVGAAWGGTAEAAEHSNAQNQELVHATLVADAAAVETGKPFQIGVLLKMKPDWHVYWRNPGDSGLATAVEFQVPQGYTVGPLVWPRPGTYTLPGDIIQYSYKDEVLLKATVTPPQANQATGPLQIHAQVSWLACNEACVPGDAHLTHEVRIVQDAEAAQPANAELFQTWAKRTDPPAPKLDLADQDGKKVTLADLTGKVVVLEWFNPECPFVRRHHAERTTMVDLARKYAPKGVVWLAVNSTHDMDAEANKAWRRQWRLPYPVLIDQDGAAGQAWQARTTPHMFIISAEGRIVYQGAIDDDPRGRNEKPTNYVDQALAEHLADKPVSEPVTRPYGCNVKYPPKDQ